jgi:hypothetical protein
VSDRQAVSDAEIANWDEPRGDTAQATWRMLLNKHIAAGRDVPDARQFALADTREQYPDFQPRPAFGVDASTLL